MVYHRTIIQLCNFSSIILILDLKRNSEINAYYKYGTSFEMISGKYLVLKLL